MNAREYPRTSITDLLVLSEEEVKLLKKHKKLKLQIELIPGSSWYSNVRSEIKSSQWDRIKKQVFADANFLCEVCGGKGIKHPVECHEIWFYNETTLTQKLNGFQALCPLCHEVKHIGLASIRGNKERAFERFRTINKLSLLTARKIMSAVKKEAFIRGTLKWELDIELLKQYENLKTASIRKAPVRKLKVIEIEHFDL